MDWYRVFHGLPYDVRLGVVAKRAGLGRAEALGLFIALLDTASQAHPRGSAVGFDAETAGIALDIPPAKVEAALQALRDKGMISAEGQLAGSQWLTPPSTERVRHHRARKLELENLRHKRRRITTAKTDPDDPAVMQERRQRLREAARMQKQPAAPLTGEPSP